MPASPGSRWRSPSSVIPWTAMATRPASAVCRCSASSTRARPGRALTRPAIARPSATEIATHTSAMTPAARDASHQPYSAGSGLIRTRPGSAPPRRRPGRAARRGLASSRRPASGPESSAALASVSASSTLGAIAVAESTPVQAGAPVLGSSRWCARAPSGVRQARATTLEVATAVSRRRSRAAGSGRSGWATSTSCVAAEADVAAGVDHPAGRRREHRGDAVGDEALAGAAEVEPQAGRAEHGAGPVVDAHLAPARGGVRVRRAGRSRRARRERRGRGRASAGSRRPRARRAGTDRRARRLSAAARSAARTAARSSADAGTTARGSALSAHSSESGRNRESRASAACTAARAAATRAAARGALDDQAHRRAEGGERLVGMRGRHADGERGALTRPGS